MVLEALESTTAEAFHGASWCFMVLEALESTTAEAFHGASSLLEALESNTVEVFGAWETRKHNHLV